MRNSEKHKLIILAGTFLFSGTPASIAQSPSVAQPAASTPAAPAGAAQTPAAQKKPCPVKMVDPTHCGGNECEKVIDVVRGITKALADQDFETMRNYMDENCSCYDERSKKLVTGRDNIIADIKAHFDTEEKRRKVSAIGFTIDHPYAKVDGDMATVNFQLIKEIGGEHPVKYAAPCTDVLVKKDGQWKKLMFRGAPYQLVK